MIEVNNLTKTYKQTKAVDNITFKVQPGIVTGFLGPNGSGKSTTMRMILGLDKPDTGEVLINGQHFENSKIPLKEIGALLEARTDKGRSARNHLRALGATVGVGKDRVDEVIELVGLSNVSRKAVGGFSLGMGQRLGIAGALLADPKIIMLDEPVNGLDPDGVLWIRHLLKNLAETGKTVFLSSHLMSEMELTADHLVVIGKGKLLADLPMQEIIDHAKNTEVEVNSSNNLLLMEKLNASGFETRTDKAGFKVQGVDAKTIGEIAHQENITLIELHTMRASLEEAFMALTEHSLAYRSGNEGANP